MKRKFAKIIMISFAVIVILIFAAWQSFNYYWRTRATINTFSSFSEPGTISYTDIVLRESNLGSINSPIGSFFINVTLNGIDGNFYMQFDTGAPRSSLYGRILKKLQEKHLSLRREQSKNGNPYFKSVKLNIADVAYEADSLKVLPNMGNAVLDSSFNII